MKTQPEVSILGPGRGSSLEPDPTGTLTSDCQHPGLWEIHFCCLKLQRRGIVLEQPDWTATTLLLAITSDGVRFVVKVSPLQVWCWPVNLPSCLPSLSRQAAGEQHTEPGLFSNHPWPLTPHLLYRLNSCRHWGPDLWKRMEPEDPT